MNNKILISTLILLVVLSISSTDLFISSLPTMMKDLSCNISAISYVVSGYIFGFSVSILFSGTLSDLFGRRKVLLVTSFIYLATNLIMSFTHNLQLLIILRVIEGIGGGGGFIIARLIVRDYFNSKSQLNVLTMISTGNAVAPAIAPQLGAFIDQRYGWHGCFLFNFLLSIIAFFLIYKYLQETLLEKSSYNPLKKLPFSIIKDFQSKQFIAYTLFMALAWTIYFIFIVFSSAYFQNIAQYSTKKFTYVVIITTCGYLIGANLTRYFNKSNYQIPKILKLSVKISSASTLLLIFTILLKLHILTIIATFILLLGVGLAIPTAQLGAIRSCKNNFGWYTGFLFFIEFLVSGLLLSFASHIEILKLGYGMLLVIVFCMLALIINYQLIKEETS